ALYDHELVKVRFQDFKDNTRALSEELAERSSSVLVSTTGFTAVFWKENPENKHNEKK
nr:YhbY family RNA-binding protein [Sphaerochaetaceae bacterium]